MNPTKEEAKQNIARLVERFSEHVDEYRHGSYNEHQTRVDYINPFFKALGWDMDNEQGFAEAYREVIHEDKVKVGGATKAPDYAFTLFGQRKFFVDAKKPSIHIKDDMAPAYQVRRYGWSAKVPIAVVTDFEEFAIYDCSKKPKPTDKASVSRIKYITYDQYLDEFDFLWDIFAKENLPKGRFDKFVKSDTAKKGTTTVDDEFLKSIESWRIYLATGMAWKNRMLGVEELNYAVQKIIDRIIFLRMCEDRGVESYGNLQKATAKGDVYANLFVLFRTADEKYNSGLFDFGEDTLTPGLKIDNKTLKIIIRELYYPECEYEFSVMPADILGSVYERFLGKTIRLTPAHHAKIEEKPEVRKAGGVYYTPKYIVDYIVENTVGKLVEGKTPGQVEKLKICDPACGSGSFLIGAYQFLLDWHLRYYLPEFGRLSEIASSSSYNRKERDKAVRDRAKLPLSPDGKLTTALKKQILLNNIYGVDIDSQAVEVTKLNLLLKALEGETASSITTEMTFGNRVLPNLANNIKCGNSLIGPDFYDTQMELFPDQIKKINAFDWEREFPEVFREGDLPAEASTKGGLPAEAKVQAGFDGVIGNPPYVRQELLGEQKTYFAGHYKVFHGMADLYTYFFEKGISILNKDGLFGIIVANKWMRAKYGEPLRKWLKSQSIIEIIDFGDLPVFQGATTYPCIFISGKNGKQPGAFSAVEVPDLNFSNLKDYLTGNRKQISKDTLNDQGWQLVSVRETTLLEKLKANSIPLGEYVKGKIYRGVLTGLNEAFVIDEETKNRLIQEDPKSADVIKPFLAGRDIKRYQVPVSDKYLIFFTKGFTNQNTGGKKASYWFSETYPAIARHLLPFADKAEKRFDKGEYWWELRACDYYEEFEKPKIMLPDIAIKPQITFDRYGYYCVNTAYIIPTEDLFLVGILNSKLIHFYYSSITSTIRGGYMRFIRQYLVQIPIPVKNKKNESVFKEIENKTVQVMSLNQQLNQTRITSQRDQLQRTIEHTERKIDELVYGLYGLGEEEIVLIESSIKQ
ncbi:MAG: Eco57I restriction-modification methylase domain-containing protein [Bacteroidales bacterium]